jgi:hypothetical protein
MIGSQLTYEALRGALQAEEVKISEAAEDRRRWEIAFGER